MWIYSPKVPRIESRKEFFVFSWKVLNNIFIFTVIFHNNILSLQIIAFDELKTDYKNPIDQCNSLNPVSVANLPLTDMYSIIILLCLTKCSIYFIFTVVIWLIKFPQNTRILLPDFFFTSQWGMIGTHTKFLDSLNHRLWSKILLWFLLLKGDC